MLLTRGAPGIALRWHQSPVNQRVIDECLQDCHQRFFVVTQDSHGDLAGVSIATLYTADLWRLSCPYHRKRDSAYLHRVCEHSCKPEWYFFRELLAMHRYLKAVTKIDMDHLSCLALKHKI